MAIHFRLDRRCRWVQCAALLAIGVAAVSTSACSGQGSATEMANSPIRLEIAAMFVTVENQAGLPLTDVKVSIVPYGSQTMFTRFVGRLDNGEKRDLMLGDFSGRDGTRFNLRAVRAKAVRIEAVDLNNKKYDVEYPWK